jgi:hypothetical protein
MTGARLGSWLLVALATVSCDIGGGLSRSPLDRPMAVAWPAVNRWSERLEDEYADFVARLGAAVEARRCDRLDACLADPEANSTYEPLVDSRLRLDADCADLPYLLRAYFAFKRRLPFGFVWSTRGQGSDPRYAAAIVPVEWRAWRDFATPRVLLRELGNRVHSGMYRTAAEIEHGDFYPVRIDRRSVRPGTIFYDPLGHVSVVARVREDGEVLLVGGTPEGNLSWKRFGSAYILGRPDLGGGFKRFRPLALERRRVVRAPNAELPDYDGTTQHDPSVRQVAGRPVGYHDWVRASLSLDDVTRDPVADLRDQVRALCRDVAERVEAVDLAVRSGVAARRHPGTLPANIYGTDGDWETYSTPSRDARMKAAFRELATGVRAALADRPGLAPLLGVAWAEELASPACTFTYTSSAGQPVAFTLDTVLDRLFDLSFDPYHCPELRWGAPAGSAELAACTDGPEKRRWYEAERLLRNRIDRDYGVPTTLRAGPEACPDVDVRPLLPEPGADTFEL